jgi:hypothetical protein
MLDADLERFQTGLHTTRHGLRLRLAMHEGNIAVRQIERMACLGSRYTSAIETWQRAYIKACNNASTAIDQLWDEYRWPADAARARDFIYRPRPK